MGRPRPCPRPPTRTSSLRGAEWAGTAGDLAPKDSLLKLCNLSPQAVRDAAEEALVDANSRADAAEARAAEAEAALQGREAPGPAASPAAEAAAGGAATGRAGPAEREGAWAGLGARSCAQRAAALVGEVVAARGACDEAEAAARASAAREAALRGEVQALEARLAEEARGRAAEMLLLATQLEAAQARGGAGAGAEAPAGVEAEGVDALREDLLATRSARASAEARLKVRCPQPQPLPGQGERSGCGRGAGTRDVARRDAVGRGQACIAANEFLASERLELLAQLTALASAPAPGAARGGAAAEPVDAGGGEQPGGPPTALATLAEHLRSTGGVAEAGPSHSLPRTPLGRLGSQRAPQSPAPPPAGVVSTSRSLWVGKETPRGGARAEGRLAKRAGPPRGRESAEKENCPANANEPRSGADGAEADDESCAVAPLTRSGVLRWWSPSEPAQRPASPACRASAGRGEDGARLPQAGHRPRGLVARSQARPLPTFPPTARPTVCPPPLPYLSPYRSPYCMPVAPMMSLLTTRCAEPAALAGPTRCRGRGARRRAARRGAAILGGLGAAVAAAGRDAGGG